MNDSIIPRARDKLEGARYHELKILTAYPEYEDVIKHELDALLSKLRSVRGALLEDANQYLALGLPLDAKLKERDIRKVAREHDDPRLLAFVKWYRDAWNEMTRDPTFAKLLDHKVLRNVSVHRECAGTGAKSEAVGAVIQASRDVYIRVLDGKTGEFVRKIRREPHRPAPQPSESTANANIHLSFDDGENVLEVCQRMLSMMTRYVDQAEVELERYKPRNNTLRELRKSDQGYIFLS
jgi:hypothetical protein